MNINIKTITANINPWDVPASPFYHFFPTDPGIVGPQVVVSDGMGAISPVGVPVGPQGTRAVLRFLVKTAISNKSKNKATLAIYYT